ncbi:hypothetical protein BN7_6465 [Wickerhamomyces ciferrii]|uniref:N-acetyltransferase domain-containing protein n=1 Tax=Wickerhamomyces ciferrii (strain ATCC 14091 / BCRC 22168 / CBS 111 / JCM 3599 / NBRC 0793 / NRRL Y-1031 F-60-10) TaxID=1206466 RepID=K0L0B6_WICCF|nr:uncharacterized protein BN7_6465 [Wickerhamomyces ciferrii]CCH46863.1 hypothetical protein BN7_6465 [Wickerhamomyces ciferrii]
MVGTGSGPLLRKPLGKVTEPKIVTLRDGTKATVYPINSVEKIPQSLFNYLHKEFNEELDRGQTYPYYHQQSSEEFKESWFQAFVAIMLKGENPGLGDESTNWDELYLGTYYIKPNYAGRCSHNCNAGFLVSTNSRGKGVGKALGKTYLDWAPVLGYTYSVFNLVFVTNVASVKIWDSLGFDRIGLVPKAADLKGYDEPVDAIQFGKRLA